MSAILDLHIGCPCSTARSTLMSICNETILLHWQSDPRILFSEISKPAFFIFGCYKYEAAPQTDGACTSSILGLLHLYAVLKVRLSQEINSLVDSSLDICERCWKSRVLLPRPSRNRSVSVAVVNVLLFSGVRRFHSWSLALQMTCKLISFRPLDPH